MLMSDDIYVQSNIDYYYHYLYFMERSSLGIECRTINREGLSCCFEVLKTILSTMFTHLYEYLNVDGDGNVNE